jgi:hypothetical protein
MAFAPVAPKKEGKKGAQAHAQKAPVQSEKARAQETQKKVFEEEFAYRRGLVALRDFISPASFEIQTTYSRLGSQFVRTLFVVGYPRYIAVGWFSPIINYSASFDVSFFLRRCRCKWY